MNLRQRKKLWRKNWFSLRFHGYDFHSFNGDDVRHLNKFKVDLRSSIYIPL